jgi:transcriptional regulator with XRE-family HTH domain
MRTRAELMKTEGFWFETIQNEIFRMVDEYLSENDINRTEFAKRLGYSKGYVSQILNGEFNCSLKKLIDLTLAVDKVPHIEFKTVSEEFALQMLSIALHKQKV